MAGRNAPDSKAMARRRARPDSPWLAPLVVTGFGGVLLAAGLALLGPARADALREQREVQAAPVIDARSIDRTPPGTRVLASGRLAPGLAVAAHGLALYVRQQYEGSETTSGNKGRPRWREVERTTPPFDLAAEGGVYDTHGKDTGLAGRLRAAPVVDAVSIQSQPAGATVLIEGRVSARNPQIESGLVTLQRQEAEAVRRGGESQPRISWKIVGGIFALVGLATLGASVHNLLGSRIGPYRV